MNAPHERREAHCPRCHAPFVLSSAARGKRIQCPKCRQTVEIAPEPKPEAAGLPTAAEFAELQARVTRQAALIKELVTGNSAPAAEPLVESTPTPAPPPGDSLLCPGQTLRWLRRETPDWAAPEEDPEQQAILLHNLRAMGQRDIVLQAGLDEEVHRPPYHLSDIGCGTVEGDVAAGEHDWKSALTLGRGEGDSSHGRTPHLSPTALVGRLSAVFRAAGWSVNEVDPNPERPRARGLVLAAGQIPMPKAATAIYMAFKAAGFPIITRLDDHLGSQQSILIAGSAGDS